MGILEELALLIGLQLVRWRLFGLCFYGGFWFRGLRLSC